MFEHMENIDRHVTAFTALENLGGNDNLYTEIKQMKTSINSKRDVQDKRHDCSALLNSVVNIISTVIIF